MLYEMNMKMRESPKRFQYKKGFFNENKLTHEMKAK